MALEQEFIVIRKLVPHRRRDSQPDCLGFEPFRRCRPTNPPAVFATGVFRDPAGIIRRTSGGLSSPPAFVWPRSGLTPGMGSR
jgi:hypothetical protein